MQSAHRAFGGHQLSRGVRFFDDLMTFDRMSRQVDANGNEQGRKLPFSVKMADGKTADSTGAFFVGELERLDMTLHEPLVAVSWGRDIDLREDVTIADEVSSFTASTYASSGSLGTGNSIGNGKAWIGKTTDQIAGVDVDLAKIANPLRPWALELKYTILEIESAARLGRPIDVQKFNALRLKHEMDVDEQVYVGDTANGDTGLLNNAGVTATNVTAGALGSTLWSQKSPDEILADFNQALTSVWAAAGWAVMPDRGLIPPAQYGQLATQKVSLAGNVSVLTYILENNIVAKSEGPGKFKLFPLKWCIGSGAGGTLGTVGKDRMVIYNKNKDRVRFPMTPMQRTPVQFDSIYHKSTYFCRLGRVEFVYAITAGYFDLI